jgi:branched-chain amino acid transport system substrate-binding protein
MMVGGRKITVIAKDDQGKPDLAKTLLAEAYADDKVDLAIGTTVSPAGALAMLPVAEEYKKILIVEPAVADSITGDKWNRYIFRTGRNSSQDAISNAVRHRPAGVNIATLAQDYAFGRDGVKAFKEALARYRTPRSCSRNTRRRTRPTSRPRPQRIFDALKDKPGRKIVWVIWAGAQPACQDRRISTPDKRFGIEARDRRQHPARDEGLQAVSRHGGRDCTTTTKSPRTR